MNPQQYCRQVCQESGSNFVKTFAFLPKPRRLGFEAFYAFCRLVDDAVDEAPSPAVAEQELSLWSREVDAIYNGTPQTPVGKALAPIVQDFEIPKDHLDDLVKGCEMDLHNESYESFEALQTYCYRVASCVGLVCLHLFGAELTDATKQAAIDLGMAVQITNILRDVTSDMKRNRIYLPLNDLQQFQVSQDDMHQPNGKSDAILKLLRFEIARARDFYKRAWDGFPKERRNQRQLMTARMMGKIYERILDKIEADPMRIFTERVQLSGWQKIGISLRTASKVYLSL